MNRLKKSTPLFFLFITGVEQKCLYQLQNANIQKLTNLQN